MSEFQEIKTQEEFDSAIKSRLDRERETVRKEVEESYKDFISPEDFAEKTKKQSETIEALTKSVADKDKEIQGYQRESLKAKVAREAGIPRDAVGFLTGENEEELKKNAEALKKVIGERRTEAPLATPEKRGDDGKDAALKNMLKSLNLKEDE